MRHVWTVATCLIWSLLAAAQQQNHAYIYMYDSDAIPGVSYTNHIDGLTGSVPQSTSDTGTGCVIGGITVSCACTSLTPPTCVATPTTSSNYTWPDSDFTTWTSHHCGNTLRGTSTTSCTVNLNFKSVTNGGPNSWAPSYIFTQDWANIAAQLNVWQPNQNYPIGFTITCTGLTYCPGTTYYYQMVASPTNGMCQSNGTQPTSWPSLGGLQTDGSCTWYNAGLNAPPQDVVVSSADYPGTIPQWSSGNSHYQAGTVVIPDTLIWNGHYYKEGYHGTCTGSTSGACTSGSGISTWPTGGGWACDTSGGGNCAWEDQGTEASLNINSNSYVDTLSIVQQSMPAVWETPFAVSQNLFYQAALQHYANTSSGIGAPANQIQYMRTGIGVGEEASIAGAGAIEKLYTGISGGPGTLTDAQLKGIWINRVTQVYAMNVATMQSISPVPTWVMMALINCGTGLSTSPGTDCTWADAEAQSALAYEPYYGGYGSQGLQTSDIFNQQNIAQCQLPFEGQSCCSDNWCETRYYMTGKMPYIELQELCSSYFAAGAPSTSCIYDPSFPNSSLSEVLAIATQHGTNVIELGIPEFECAYGSTCTASYPAAMIANQNAIQNASVGQPSATTAIFGTLDLLGFGNIF